MSLWKHHVKLERHSLLLVVGIVLVVSVGGLVEIAPLFWLKSTIEKVEGIRPYTPLELTRSSGGPSGPGRTSPGSAASTRTAGTATTLSTLARSSRSR
jgi:hypothetical protein